MNGSRAMCAPGFASIACSACADGYFLQFGNCAKCPKAKSSSVAAVLLAVFAVILVAFVIFRVRAFLPIAVIKVRSARC